MYLNLDQIEREVARVPNVTALLDIGCDDGERTRLFAGSVSATELHGIEIVPEAAAEAEGRGVTVAQHDLDEGPWPYPDARFDLLISNQVIEHVDDPDLFVSESARILRHGGTAVVSTENLASWHNIAALVLGWQPFSLTNISTTKLGIGNPLALHRDAPSDRPTWTHNQVFAYRGLVELFEAHGFEVVKVSGAGYHPLSARIGTRDPRHAHFLTVTARRR
jgi:2-polyprenyl-3-methyl-5-hydroxy-6-metoxy-1,4-benzoquinol methylase